jgi:RNA polymerase sigma-70 factor (ECF subfamily)
MIVLSEKLYEGVLKGDMKSNTEFYNIIRGVMLPEARANFGNDVALVDDVVQMAMIKLHEKLPTIDLIKVIGYAKLIIFTTCMDIHRQNKKGIQEVSFDLETDGCIGITYEVPDLGVDEYKTYEPDAVKAKLDKAIDKLPPKYKQVFTMFHLDNMTHAEIFDEIGGSTKANLARAKRKLRKDLGSFEETLMG